MGSDNFEDVAFGKTPEEAFNTARTQAQYDYGHAGDTGTIAEKGWFHIFIPPIGFTSREFLDLISDYDIFNEVSKWNPNPTEKFTSRKKEHVAWRKTQWGQKATKLYKKYSALDRLNQDVCKKANDVYEDKWGDAVCVELTGKAATDLLKKRYGTPSHYINGKPILPKRPRGIRVFIFAGYASS